MRLFYTGVNEEGEVQGNPSLSLGGHVSGSPLPNGAINNLFGGISQNGMEKGIRQVRAIALKNETGATVNPIIWYDNISNEPITNYRFAFVMLIQDDCGWYMEKIGQGNSLPINATFIDPKTQINAVSLPAIPNNGYIGIWIERTYNQKAVLDSQECENLLEKFNTENKYQVSTIQFPADIADSLDGRYFELDTPNEKYAIWYSTGAGAVQPVVVGRQPINVTIITGDSADDVALKTNNQINTIIVPRGGISSSVLTDTVTITGTLFGAFPIPSNVDVGVTVVAVTAGTNNGLEVVEDMEIQISY